MDGWKNIFSGAEITITRACARAFIREFGMAFAVIAALWFIKCRTSAFFLVKGQLDAPIELVHWLGIRAGELWRTFGWIFAVVASLAVLIPTISGLHLTTGLFFLAMPLLPSILLFAAINAFS
jgi:hypothetical protein